MVIAYRTRPEDHAKRLLSRIEEAQSHLQKFPQLRSLVEDFSNLEIKDKIRNIFLNFCIDQRAELADFEGFLSSFEVMLWPKGRLSRFRSRVLANNWEESMSALAEGVIARFLSKRLGVENIEPGPELDSGKLSDIRVKLDHRLIFLEITSVGTGLFEQKLETAFDETCKILIPRIVGNRFVDIIVDSTKLPLDTNGHVNVIDSISVLNKYIDSLGLVSLFNSSISPLVIELEKIAHLPEKAIYELATEIAIPNSKVSWLQLLYPRMAQQLLDDRVVTWAKTTVPSAAMGCPIVNFSAVDGNIAGVQIQDRKVHPSLSSELEMKAFVSHLGRVLENKIVKSQFQPGSPNIIVIRVHNWLSHGYEESRNFLILDFKTIADTVKETLDKVKSPHIAYVCLHESDFARARLIPNEYVDSASRISDSELCHLGLKLNAPQEPSTLAIET